MQNTQAQANIDIKDGKGARENQMRIIATATTPRIDKTELRVDAERRRGAP